MMDARGILEELEKPGTFIVRTDRVRFVENISYSLVRGDGQELLVGNREARAAIDELAKGVLTGTSRMTIKVRVRGKLGMPDFVGKEFFSIRGVM